MRALFSFQPSRSPVKARLLGSSALVLTTAFLAGSLPSAAAADTIYYDNETPGGVIGTVDGGVWNTSTENWNDDDDGTGSELSFENNRGDDVIFGATGVTVDVEVPVRPRSITFDVTGYVIRPADGAVNPEIVAKGKVGNAIPAGMSIDVTNVDDIAQISTNLSSAGKDDRTFTINSSGDGTLQLTGDNTDAVSTLDLQGGQLTNRGDWGGEVEVNGGLFLALEGEIQDVVTVDGGELVLRGGTFSEGGGTGQIDITTGLVRVRHGSDPITDADREVDVNVNGGELLIVGGNTLTGDITQTAGAVNNNGIYVGTADVGGGVFTNDGDVTGAIDVTGMGMLVVEGGTITGTVSTNAVESKITLSGGTVTAGVLNKAGTTTVDGAASATVTNGDDMTAGTLNITGTGVLTGGVINEDGTTTNDGEIIGTVTVNGGTFDNNNTLTGTALVNGGGIFNANGGTATGLVTNQGGDINLLGGGFTTGILNQSGTVDLLADTTAPVTNAGGTVTITDTFTLTGAYGSTDGDTNVIGTIAGPVTLSGGDINVLATGLIDDTVAVSGSGVLNNELNGEVAGLVTNNGGTVNDNGGTFTGGIVNNSGNVFFNVPATTTAVTNEGGTVNIDAATTWTHNYVSNKGATINDGTLMGTLMLSGDDTDAIADVFTNNGDIIGNVTVDGSGVLDAESGSTLQGKLILDGGVVNAKGGTFNQEILNQGGALNIAGATTVDVRNTAGLLTIQNGETLTGKVDNIGGDMNNLGTLTGALVITGGSVTNAGDMNSTVRLNAGNMDANSGEILGQTTVLGGQLNAGGTAFSGGLRGQGGTIIVDGDTTAALTNVGAAVTVQGSQTLTGAVVNTSGTINNQGTLDGTVKISGGNVSSSGTITEKVTVNAGGTFTPTGGMLNADVINAGGNIAASGGTFAGQLRTNAGQTDIDGEITVATLTNAGGTLNINGAGQVNGSVNSLSGTTTQEGLVTDSVTVSGGTYNAEGRVNLDLTNNGGDVVADGGRIDGATRNNAGTLTVAGNTTGTLTNASTLTIDAGARWIGGVTHNGGVANNNGVVTDTLKVRGNSWSQNSGANTLGQTTLLTGGTLIANGGRFDGGIVANAGSLTIAADTYADIRNNGIALTIGTARSVFGDFTNSGGTLQLNGKLFGDLAISDNLVSTGANSRVNGATTLTGTGQLDMNGGTFTEEVRSVSGDLNVNASVIADIRNVGASVAIGAAGQLNGKLTQISGTTTNNGELGGLVTVNGGTLTNNGSMTNGLVVGGTGTVDHDAGSINGTSNLTGGELNLNGGSVGNSIVNNGGVVNLNADITTNMINRSGDFFINSGQEITGFVRNLEAGYVRLDGSIDGNLINRGLVDYFGDVTGTLTNTGTINTDPGDARAKTISNDRAYTLSGPTSRIGIFENTRTGVLELDDRNIEAGYISNLGTITIENGFVLASTGDADFGAPSTLTINDGTLAGNMSFAAGATVDLTDATLEGDVTSQTLISSAGTTRILTDGAGPADLALSGLGQLVVDGDLFSVSGDITTDGDTVLTVNDGATLQAGNLTSNGDLTLGAGATLRTSGLGTNTGNATFADGSMVEGAFSNSGVIIGTGTLSFADGLTGGGRVNLASNSATSDRVNIGGDLGAQTFDLDIDLSGTTGTADTIVMSPGAFVTGDVVLNFNVLGAGGEQDEDVVVLDAATGQDTINAIANGLPDASDLSLTDGIIVYGLTQNSAGDLVVFDALDQGISSIAGTIVLAQSLIGSVINRPSSPFVSGLAFEDEDPCGAGLWARGIGGSADATGEIDQVNGTTEPFDSSISADYYGVQLGGDYACFNGFYNGWDVAFGAIGGVNIGKSNQPIFAPDTSSDTGLSDIQTSVTDVDFTQAYGGVYVAAVRDRLAVDLQYRIEKTDYTATNVEATGGASLGLTDEKFTSDGKTLSGAVSYSLPIQETGLTFVPTVGFAYSQISTDPINFVGRGVVQIDDFDSQIGFAGGTVTRTIVGDDGVSALTQFGTLTLYKDFAENPTSTFTRSDNGDVTRISSENLGAYGEISAGLNYVRILQPGEFGAVKQFNASVRGDFRVSDRLDSWGVTAQARFQF